MITVKMALLKGNSLIGMKPCDIVSEVDAEVAVAPMYQTACNKEIDEHAQGASLGGYIWNRSIVSKL